MDRRGNSSLACSLQPRRTNETAFGLRTGAPTPTPMALYNTGVLYGSGATYAGGGPQKERKNKTMPLPSDSLIGFATQVKEFLAKYKTELTAKNYDPTNDIASLMADCGTFATEDQKQESIKTDLKNQTEKVNGLGGDLYDMTSSTLDAAVGKLGKTTAEGKEGQKIRSNLRGKTPKPPKPPTP